MTLDVGNRHGPRDTVERLLAAIEQRGMTVFTCIDHAAAPRAARPGLPATEVVVFGDPQTGTLVMQSAQTMGLDLPLRALVWEDASGVTRVTVQHAAALAALPGRRGVAQDVAPVLARMATALEAVARDAADHPSA